MANDDQRLEWRVDGTRWDPFASNSKGGGVDPWFEVEREGGSASNKRGGGLVFNEQGEGPSLSNEGGVPPSSSEQGGGSSSNNEGGSSTHHPITTDLRVSPLCGQGLTDACACIRTAGHGIPRLGQGHLCTCGWTW